MSKRQSSKIEEFSAVDDQNIWEAFLAASHSVELGFKQVSVSPKFQRNMDDAYLKKLDKENIQRKYVGLREKNFETRPLESIIARYNNFIGPEVFRFLLVMKTTPMTRKKPNEAFYKECRERFATKYGRPFVFSVRKQDFNLIWHWFKEVQLDDPDIVLLEVSDAASGVSNGIKEICDSLGIPRSIKMAVNDITFGTVKV